MSIANSSQCIASNPGIEIALNSTASRICGSSSTNSSGLGTCCGRDGDAEVHQYQCSHYCSTRLSIQDFVGCLIDEGIESEDSIAGAQPFCQSGIASNTTERLTSSGISRARPTYGCLFWALALGFMLIGQVHGSIVPSLSTDLHRRDTTTCSFDMDRNYTSTGATKLVSGEFDCDQSYCFQNIPMDSGYLNNNRTFNYTSAAEPRYDAFFELLQNQTGRKFPALSSVELNLDFVATSGSYSVGFTPLRWCVNGTVSACADLVGTDDPTLIDVCGPLFVNDDAPSDEQAADQDTIQGIILPVYFG